MSRRGRSAAKQEREQAQMFRRLERERAREQRRLRKAARKTGQAA